MKPLTAIVLATAFFCLFCLPAAAKQTAPGFEETCEIIIGRVTDDCLSKIKDVAKLNDAAEENLVYIKPDGSFSDIDYASKARSNWPAQEHLTRLSQLTQAYITEGGKLYRDTELYENIVNMLQFWFDHNPRSDNWWYNQVGAPRALGLILVLMRSGEKQVPEELERKILDRMAHDGGDPRERTGANKGDIALHWMYRGCLMQDEEVLDIAMTEAFEPAAYTTGEGIQYDGSYFQHHSQLYIGGYSTVLINRIAEIAWYTIGTRYALNKEQIDILNSYIVDTYLGMTRGNTIAFNVIGRSISRRGALSQGSSIGWLRKMSVIDSKRAWEYEDGISSIYGKSKVPVLFPQTFTHFYTGDYSMFRNNAYSFGVRMVSSRTWRSEELNGENTKGYFISDGSTSINVTGQEYNGIFPTWDWTKVPGTTATQKTVPSMDGVWTHPGESKFTGGISNGKTGASVYTMDNHADSISIAANKAWFFFGNEVLCLGNGISSDMDEDIATTVNQCMTDGQTVWSKNSSETLMKTGDSFSDEAVDWVINDGICYFFPEAQAVSAKSGKRSGCWKNINRNYSGETVTNDVFTLWINHGTKPSDAKYSYIVVPGITAGSKADSYDTEKIKIIENSKKLMAASHNGIKTDMAVFLEAATVEFDDMTVTTDKPCIVMKDKKNIYVSDPSQILESVTITVQKQGKPAEKYVFDLSADGVHRGKTHSVKL